MGEKLKHESERYCFILFGWPGCPDSQKSKNSACLYRYSFVKSEVIDSENILTRNQELPGFL